MTAHLKLRKLLDRLAASLDPTEEEILHQFIAQWSDSGGLDFYRKLQQERDCLQKVLEVGKALNSRDNLETLLALILDKAIEMVRAERGFILLVPEGNVAVARNFDREWISEPAFKVSRSVATAVLETGRPLLTADAQKDPKIGVSSSIRNLGLKSVLCVPLVAQKQVLGALYLDNRFCHGAFYEHHLFILQMFAEQAALALQDTRLRNALRERESQIEKLAEQPTGGAGRAQIAQEIARGRENIDGQYRFGELLSCNRQMGKLFEIAARTAQSGFPVLITGESGTGKGLLARAIHGCGKHSQGQFVEENCAAIAETLLESELFGYVRGAFTGANRDHKGLLETADGGTLFLDEIGEMSLPMQAKLLKVLENKAVRPLGSEEWRKVDACLISATHRDLPQMIREQKFREDLWYRLRVISLDIPPLRDRPEDIPFLIRHFLSRPQTLAKQIEIDPKAMEILLNYSWPGNVRQLDHEIQRLTVMKAPGAKILAQDVSLEITQRDYLYIAAGLTLKEAARRFEHNYVVKTLREAGGNKTKAAKRLGLSRRGLYNKLGIEDPPESQV